MMATRYCPDCGDDLHPDPEIVHVCPARGVKADRGKPRYDLLPHRALEQVAHVLTFGATKYAAENWRKVPGWRWRYYGAALRHLTAWWMGERLDPESGLPHLAHTLCCVLFLLELELAEGGRRPPPWEGSEPPPMHLPDSGVSP